VNPKPPANMVLRVGVWFLAVATLAVGVVATLAPRAFYDRVPWVSLAPPYSEHLMRDYGAMNLALALIMVVAAITMDRLMIRTSLAAYVVFAIPHLLFHVTHHQHYTTAQAVGETTALVVAALLPLGLLMLTRRSNVPPR
jgi:hypothetical protein